MAITFRKETNKKRKKESFSVTFQHLKESSTMAHCFPASSFTSLSESQRGKNDSVLKSVPATCCRRSLQDILLSLTCDCSDVKWRTNRSAPPWVHVSCTRLRRVLRLTQSENGQRRESVISTVNEVSSHTPDLFIQLSPARYVLPSYIMQHDCLYCARPSRTWSHWVLFITFFNHWSPFIF